MMGEFQGFSLNIKNDVKSFIDNEAQRLRNNESSVEEHKKSNVNFVQYGTQISNFLKKSQSLQMDQSNKAFQEESVHSVHSIHESVHSEIISHKNKINEKEAQEIFSEPVDHNEVFNALTNDTFSNKFKTIINTKTNLKNSILNDPFSSLNKVNVLKKTLDCIKGERVSIPTQQFLKVTDLNINDVNTKEMDHAKNIYDIQTAFDYFKNDADRIIQGAVGSSLKVFILFNFYFRNNKKCMIIFYIKLTTALIKCKNT